MFNAILIMYHLTSCINDKQSDIWNVIKNIHTNLRYAHDKKQI